MSDCTAEFWRYIEDPHDCQSGGTIRSGRALTFIALSLACQICSAVFGKFAALAQTSFTLRQILENRYYLLSLACLGLQAVCWPLALRHMPLFRAYLFMSGVYLAIPVLSRYVFHETLTAANLAGAVLIAAGIGILLRKGGTERLA